MFLLFLLLFNLYAPNFDAVKEKSTLEYTTIEEVLLLDKKAFYAEYCESLKGVVSSEIREKFSFETKAFKTKTFLCQGIRYSLKKDDVFKFEFLLKIEKYDPTKYDNAESGDGAEFGYVLRAQYQFDLPKDLLKNNYFITDKKALSFLSSRSNIVAGYTRYPIAISDNDCFVSLRYSPKLSFLFREIPLNAKIKYSSLTKKQNILSVQCEFAHDNDFPLKLTNIFSLECGINYKWNRLLYNISMCSVNIVLRFEFFSFIFIWSIYNDVRLCNWSTLAIDSWVIVFLCFYFVIVRKISQIDYENAFLDFIKFPIHKISARKS